MSRGKPWVPSEQDLEEKAISEDEESNPTPTRGRPKLSPDKHRKNSVTLTFTDEEYGNLMLVAAGERKHLRIWARETLLDAVNNKSK